jgi:hypothetical protein
MVSVAGGGLSGIDYFYNEIGIILLVGVFIKNAV